jgi:PKD repeat protein
MKIRILIPITICAAFALALAATGARAVVVDSEPTWPIPTDAPTGPPPIPALSPATGAAPPADQIGDPVTPAADCGGWYLQSSYGGRWPAGASWWEYRCNASDYQYHDTCPGPICNAWCPSCWWETRDWSDYFYWDGSQAVFYGESYSYTYISVQEAEDGMLPYSSAHWWDGPTTLWYGLGPYELTVSTLGAGAGAVSSSPAGIGCPEICRATFDIGTVVTLSAAPDASSVFTGWSGDCSGTGSCQLTIDPTNSEVIATFAREPFDLTVAKAGTGSGQVNSTPSGIACGDSCQASFEAGTVVALTATPDATSTFTGWSGDCSGFGSCQVTLDRGRSVTATFALNKSPHANFSLACAGLTCSADGSGSADSDGTIVAYGWSFGDGSGGTGKTASHTYAHPGSYTVSLTVTDDGGATDSDSEVVALITLTATGSKLKGLQKVDLAWTGSSAERFDVFRNGLKIATVQSNAYTDNINQRGPGSYVYKVCAVGTSVCSNDATVSF